MKVTFEYIKTDNTKSLSSEYDKEYTQEEKDEMIEYIIDTFLPNNPLDVNQYILSLCHIYLSPEGSIPPLPSKFVIIITFLRSLKSTKGVISA
jgi:hypothetical protein